MREARKCLIIDDDQDDQEIFVMCLKKVDKAIECKTANDGIEAISLLKSGEYAPEYVFIDVNMPKMNGVDCLKILKNIGHLQYSKFFMYSTSSEKATVTRSMESGANDFIVKPSSTTDLKDKLTKIFEIVSEIKK